MGSPDWSSYALDAPTAAVAGSLALSKHGRLGRRPISPLQRQGDDRDAHVYVTFTSGQSADFAALRDLRFRR